MKYILMAAMLTLEIRPDIGFSVLNCETSFSIDLSYNQNESISGETLGVIIILLE